EAIVKPSREIFPGDKISVRKNQINYLYEVRDLPSSRIGAKLREIYLGDHTPKEEFDKLELQKYSKEYYRKKGTGRPTKKDRRDIDEWTENIEDEDKTEN
ncbi:MAG TPA: RNA-binding S4 domain-containing protein, partial [Salinimicrobium sp.]|nr:RNA-binding S4 domain-containing protein [Salinimicrobium sp.]